MDGTPQHLTSDFTGPEYKVPTLTAGDLIDWLSRFPRDTYVTVGTPAGLEGTPDWLNVVGGYDAINEYEGMSLIIETADTFDTRQF